MEAQLHKSSLRRMLRQRAGQLSGQVRASASRSICERLQDVAAYQRASTIGLFAGTTDEVDTRPIFHQARQHHKQLAVPRVIDGKQKLMTYYVVSDITDLAPGFHNILEPTELAAPIAPDAIDCVCIPGVAFDVTGARLGRGAGLYDHWLHNYHGIRVGLAYDLQVVDAVPTTPADESVDIIVTEHRTIVTHSSQDHKRGVL